jgi:anti-sigma B factor antagonist
MMYSCPVAVFDSDLLFCDYSIPFVFRDILSELNYLNDLRGVRYMEIMTTSYKRCDLVKAVGRVDSNTAPELEDAFNQILDSGRTGIVFDMDKVDFISSRGLWVLLETQKACKRGNGKLVLVNVSTDMQQSLDLAGVKHFIDMMDDITAAVGSF